MISGCYLGSAGLLALTVVLFAGVTPTSLTFLLLLVVTFFFASTGASAAYLTVSEIFPMETRAMAVAFLCAIGTVAGGIAGPLLFGQFIESGSPALVALGFSIGAAVMALGGLAEITFGIDAEGRSLEDIATPLTAQEAKQTS